MEKTLILLKPCTVQRRLIGEVINRLERKGLRIVGLKMMQLDDAICSPRRPSLLSVAYSLNEVGSRCGNMC